MTADGMGYLPATLVPFRDHETQLAMKVIPMQCLMKQKQIEHLYNEKNILHYLNTNLYGEELEYFPKLHCTFASDYHVNFVMERIDGINLLQFLRKSGSLKPEFVRYLMAYILTQIELLHEHQIMFRDLKPENIMIEYTTGDLKIVDFGFAKRFDDHGRSDRTFTKCGTPGYTAPEILTIKDQEE